MRVETRQTRKKIKPCYRAAATPSYCHNAAVAARRHGKVSSDIDVEHDRHPQPTSGGAQSHAKRVDARAGIMKVAIGKAY